MGKKLIFYINIALFIALAVIIVMILKPVFFVFKQPPIKEFKARSSALSTGQPSITRYDISKVKRLPPPAIPQDNEPSDLKEMYEYFPKSDVGDNMVEGWSRTKPEAKAKLAGVLDKEIINAQKSLKTNPEDKHAKNILLISQTLKKMAADGFNCKIKKPSSK